MQMFFKMVGRLHGGDCVLLRDMPSCYHCVGNIFCLSSSFKFFITCILLLGVITAFLKSHLTKFVEGSYAVLAGLMKTELSSSMSDLLYHDISHYNTNTTQTVVNTDSMQYS